MTKKKRPVGRPKADPTKQLFYRVPVKKAPAIDKEIRETVLPKHGVHIKKRKK